MLSKLLCVAMALLMGSSLDGRLLGADWLLIVWLLEARAGVEVVVVVVDGGRLPVGWRLPPAFGGSPLSIDVLMVTSVTS